MKVAKNSGVTLNLRRFDFWVLLAVSLIALGAEMVLDMESEGRLHAPVLVILAVTVLVLAVLLALGASRFPRQADFSTLPILAAWRSGSLTAPAAVLPLIVGIATGVLQSYAAIQYRQSLKHWLGPAPFTHPSHPQLLSVADILSSSIIEEIMFRAVLFAFLVIFIRWVWETPIANKSIPIWIANVLQSLAFGAAHVALGIGGLKASPWYVSLLLAAQTWSGLVLGCIYWKYGLESATTSHVTYDLLLLGLARHKGIRRAAMAPLF